MVTPGLASAETGKWTAKAARTANGGFPKMMGGSNARCAGLSTRASGFGCIATDAIAIDTLRQARGLRKTQSTLTRPFF
jgi:hypothetical protein